MYSIFAINKDEHSGMRKTDLAFGQASIRVETSRSRQDLSIIQQLFSTTKNKQS
ncbi:hypothetical protein [Dyadobacter endophyticus]|uniref:hypothetical protein n=1 Tax=Dyadobacter endophyticus TaxID=1749036 RepID=UPI0016644499|nr:hypothetical protein [Dyadobacter endophyticus]